MHGTAARSNILKRAWSEKVAIGTAKRAKRANTIAKNALIEAVWGSKSVYFDENHVNSFCKNVSPARAGATFLKKCDAKSELKHEKHKRSSLKLAFLMHIRNQSCGG